MTFNEILKEFDAGYSGITYPFDSKENQAVEAERKVFKSFLKQSFIKYLEGEVERLLNEKEKNYNVSYLNALTDQLNHYQAQIKELQ